MASSITRPQGTSPQAASAAPPSHTAAAIAHRPFLPQHASDQMRRAGVSNDTPGLPAVFGAVTSQASPTWYLEAKGITWILAKKDDSTRTCWWGNKTGTEDDPKGSAHRQLANEAGVSEENISAAGAFNKEKRELLFSSGYGNLGSKLKTAANEDLGIAEAKVLRDLEQLPETHGPWTTKLALKTAIVSGITSGIMNVPQQEWNLAHSFDIKAEGPDKAAMWTELDLRCAQAQKWLVTKREEVLAAKAEEATSATMSRADGYGNRRGAASNAAAARAPTPARSTGMSPGNTTTESPVLDEELLIRALDAVPIDDILNTIVGGCHVHLPTSVVRARFQDHDELGKKLFNDVSQQTKGYGDATLYFANECPDALKEEPLMFVDWSWWGETVFLIYTPQYCIARSYDTGLACFRWQDVLKVHNSGEVVLVNAPSCWLRRLVSFQKKQIHFIAKNLSTHYRGASDYTLDEVPCACQ